MNNQQFLRVIAMSFKKFLQTHPRSNEKLKVLHGKIAEDIKNKLGKPHKIKSYGIENGREGKMNGRYIEKTVDILISKENRDLAGIGVKFVMNNYSQNSNNYFENMLGETANIRAGRKKYFQILVLPEKMPYYDNKGKIRKWEEITTNNINKYIVLSNDNTETYLHAPIKTLLFIIKFPNCDNNAVTNRFAYKNFYLKLTDIKIKISDKISGDFGETVILNDYESFIKKIIFYLKSI